MKAFTAKKLNLKNSIYIFAVFLIACFVRFLIWQDTQFSVWKVQTGIVESYRLSGKIIAEDGILSFFDAGSRISNIDFLGHPPGYPILLGLIFDIFGETVGIVQFTSVLIDSFSVVLIFLIAKKLISEKAALITGMTAAFCASFALNSVLLLPDTLSVFPVLAALYLLLCAKESQKILPIIFCGICLGISCWFRSNNLLMPILFAFGGMFLFSGKKKYSYASTLILSFVLIIAPITIRNAIVYKEFIPISLGAGQILLEGIGDYDKEQKFGIPNSDFGICQMEAIKYNRPDYANTLFGPDGIKRDRMRVAQWFAFVKENPVWFSKIYLKRAVSMFNLENAQKVSKGLPVSNFNDSVNEKQAIIKFSGSALLENSEIIAKEAKLNISQNAETVSFQSDNSEKEPQFSFSTQSLTKLHEYILSVEYQIKQGRNSINIIGKDSNRKYNSLIIEFDGFDKLNEVNFKKVDIPFVMVQDESVKVIINNEPTKEKPSIFEIKQLGFYDFGESAYFWTKPIRFTVNIIQKIIVTPVVIFSALIGFSILLWQKEWQKIILIMLVPAYYVLFQSLLHTEYRYILAIHYFTFILAGIGITKIFDYLIETFNKIKTKN